MDETVRLTYTELAKARGITLPAARRLALRHKWRKQLGNDGLTHVWVPVSALPRDGMSDRAPDAGADLELDGTATTLALDAASLAELTKATSDVVSDALSELRSGLRSDLQSDFKSVLPTLQEAITSLRSELDAQREQITAERQRADRAEQRAHEEHIRADHAEQQVDTLRKELTEARTAERIITSEAADLRCRLDTEVEERQQATDRLVTAQERISALLADQRATPPTATTPTRRFWLPWRRHS